MPRPLLALAGGLLQEPLVGGGLHVHVQGGPVRLVDQADQPLEVDRVVEPRLRPGVDIAEQPLLAAEGAEGVGVGVGQVGAAAGAQAGPVAAGRQGQAALVGHLAPRRRAGFVRLRVCAVAFKPASASGGSGRPVISPDDDPGFPFRLQRYRAL